MTHTDATPDKPKPLTHDEWWRGLRASKQHRLRERLRHEIETTLYYWGAPKEDGWTTVTLSGGAGVPDMSIDLKRGGR